MVRDERIKQKRLRRDEPDTMTRWNISDIFFFGVSGARRDISLRPGAVNIVAGASGTGKSALIKTIDYCLGSSRCELPAHVRRRCVAVGMKWVAGNAEMLVGRIVPPVGRDTSTRMYVSAGKELLLPDTLEGFEGVTNVDAAKAFLERAFGIGDTAFEEDLFGEARGRATVRHATSYMFVTKEVICSESVLLHGLEQPEKAKDVLATIPYFLRAVDETTVLQERRLRQLRRALDRAEFREKARLDRFSEVKERAMGLIAESRRLGLVGALSDQLNEKELFVALREIAQSGIPASAYPNDNEIRSLHVRRTQVLASLAESRQRVQATKTALREAAAFGSAVGQQRQKLLIAEHLGLNDGITAKCPVCDAPSEKGRQIAKSLSSALEKIRAESVAIDRVHPRLVEHDNRLLNEQTELNSELRQVDERIKSWLRQTDDAVKLASLSQLQAHLLGRISYFIDTENEQPVGIDLAVLRAEIVDLEASIDRNAKEIRLRRAEHQISHFATKTISILPTVEPCIGAEVEFSSQPPEVSIVEKNSEALLKMADIGSDQNYLAIHIALAFALQRFFELAKSPVPGLLVLDQISRPYFPAGPSDHDVKEVQGQGQREDEDVQAMRRHIDFLFEEVSRRSGLQVLLIEHAYFPDDPRYVQATRERWTRASKEALIPLDWPTRLDV
jgi:hypothetical protein